MQIDPNQGVLDLEMAEPPLDHFVLKAVVSLGAPEVRYDLLWTAPNGTHAVQSCFLDSAWPIDRMSVRILNLIVSAHNGLWWEPKKVRACLDALQAAYGCPEPF